MIDFGSMTLAEVEALAQRLEEAARIFREARLILGGAAAVQPAQQPVTLAAVPPAYPPSRLSHGPPPDAAQIAAEREALLQRNREALPDDIKRAEGMT